MSFAWTRAGGNIQSRCTCCDLILTNRHEPTLLRDQRDHDAATCQRRREAARDTDRGHQIDRVTYRMSENPTTQSSTPTKEMT